MSPTVTLRTCQALQSDQLSHKFHGLSGNLANQYEISHAFNRFTSANVQTSVKAVKQFLIIGLGLRILPTLREKKTFINLFWNHLEFKFRILTKFKNHRLTAGPSAASYITEIFALSGCYTAYIGSLLSKFRDILSVQTSRVNS